MTKAATLTPEERDLLEDAARRIVAARMAVPAMMFLETVSPMNMVTSSMLRIMSPAWRSVVGESRIEDVARLLERREAISEFIRIIDDSEESRLRTDKQAKAARKADRKADKARKSERTSP